MVIHAGGEAAGAVLAPGVGGHGDDGGVLAGGLALADQAGGVDAAHDGHLHVHEDQIPGGGREEIDRLLAVLGQGDGVAPFLEEVDGQAFG
jgi:hypothetical protein